jgi:hypothetical protein
LALSLRPVAASLALDPNSELLEDRASAGKGGSGGGHRVWLLLQCLPSPCCCHTEVKEPASNRGNALSCSQASIHIAGDR